MVSDSELVGRLHEFLRTSDLNTTTTGIVRRKLEEDFGIDLSDKKAFIREQVDLFLQSQVEKAEEDEEEGDGEEGDEGENARVKSEESNGSASKHEDDSGNVDEEEEEEEEEEASNGKGTGKRGLVFLFSIINWFSFVYVFVGVPLLLRMFM